MLTFTPAQSASVRTLGIRSPGCSRPAAISARSRQRELDADRELVGGVGGEGRRTGCSTLTVPSDHTVARLNCVSQVAHSCRLASLDRVRISTGAPDELVAHARDDAPNECCGDDRAPPTASFTAYFRAAQRVRRARCAFRSHSGDQIRITNEIEAAGEEIGAIFHSHPNTEAYPSQTDVNLARVVARGSLWVICSLAGDEPVVRAFHIDGRQVEEVELVVG